MSVSGGINPKTYLSLLSQFHKLGIKGINPWRAFYQTLDTVINDRYGKCDVSYRFYGAIPPKFLDKGRYYNRTRFFSSLKKHGITVYLGDCYVSETGELSEKGVDMAIGLDLYDLSLDNYDLLFVFSGDADLCPAIKRAQMQGTKVIAILSKKQPARLVKKMVDGVISLEALIHLIDAECVIHRTKPNIPTLRERAI